MPVQEAHTTAIEVLKKELLERLTALENRLAVLETKAEVKPAEAASKTK